MPVAISTRHLGRLLAAFLDPRLERNDTIIERFGAWIFTDAIRRFRYVEHSQSGIGVEEAEPYVTVVADDHLQVRLLGGDYDFAHGL